MAKLENRVVFVTGASSGIGAACARAFAREGARLLLAARRAERMEAVAPVLREAGAAEVRVMRLDTRDARAVENAVGDLPAAFRNVEVLVNNAGLSRGLDKLHEGSLEDWNEMIDTNVKGLLHVDRAVVPLMVARGRGTVVHIGSIAGRQAYTGGNVYCATKSAVHALTDCLRLDLLGTGVRVTTVEPGMVLTEFSEVRFHGDRERAAGVYRGVVPLSADDVADLVVFAATRPDHVQIAEMVVLPTDQASATGVHRRG
jgi:3-hydroxy acid dehydrogenase / malonic semialdehyde reductase